MPEYFTSTLESNLANFPEKTDLVRGRFSKSSTQNALTMPLKLPRLANPFPERLKSFPSDTMADDEKAKQMEEEVKMVARYNLQKSQEAGYHQPEQSYQQPEGPMYYEDDVSWRESTENHQLQPPATTDNSTDEALMQSRRPQARNKPRTRAARYLKTSRHIKPTNQQRRFSSSVNPLTMSDLEQCNVIWEHLRALYPEYRDHKKPLFVPGSREEREFIENTLRCIAKHKLDTAVLVKRAPAPFPSYSEVKTFVREPRMRQIKVSSSRDNLLITRSYSTTSKSAVELSETGRDSAVPADNSLEQTVPQAKVAETAGNPTLDTQTDPYSTVIEEKLSVNEENSSLDVQRSKPDLDDLVKGSTTTRRPTEQAAQSSRCFSTKSKSCKPDKPKKPTCRPMKSAGCVDPNPNKCEIVYEKSTCKKLEAPYPSYSECMGDQYEEEPSECKICPWNLPANSTKSSTSDNSASGKKKYSTFTALGPKSKPPCKNPYDDKKPCDYERTAEQQDEKRRKRPAQPSPKSKPAHKKSFSTLATAKQSFYTLSNKRLCDKKRSNRAQYSSQSLPDNKTIVDRVRGWLNSWRPGSDNIRITQSSDLSAGRETYIIEIQDVVDARHAEIAPWVSAESLRPGAHHVVTSSGLSCAESSKKSGKVSGGGCPPPKKKEDHGDDKKKCRQRKKRKLPSCNDVGKNKPKKDALNYSTIQINDDQHSTNDQLSQQTQEINALKEPQVLENVPFKLKPQFWRV